MTIFVINEILDFIAITTRLTVYRYLITTTRLSCKQNRVGETFVFDLNRLRKRKTAETPARGDKMIYLINTRTDHTRGFILYLRQSLL